MREIYRDETGKIPKLLNRGLRGPRAHTILFESSKEVLVVDSGGTSKKPVDYYKYVRAFDEHNKAHEWLDGVISNKDKTEVKSAKAKVNKTNSLLPYKLRSLHT